MKAMILAAGLGTRLKPFTDFHPKALVCVNDKTLLQHNIEYLKKYGVTEIIVNVHHFAKQIIGFLDENNFGVQTKISDESNMVLETGGGLLKARPLLQDAENFVLMNADILTDLNLSEVINFHNQKKPLATVCVSKRNSSRALLFDENNILSGWKNSQTEETKIARKCSMYNEFSFSGIHIISSSIFEKIKFTGKFSMIDLYLDLAKQNEILGYEHNAILLDVGKPENIMKAEELFK